MLSFLAIDLFVLLILGYGKNEAHLFCLHWIYILPISIGLLLGRIKNIGIKYILTSLTIMIILVSYCYNITVYVESLTNPIQVAY